MVFTESSGLFESTKFSRVYCDSGKRHSAKNYSENVRVQSLQPGYRFSTDFNILINDKTDRFTSFHSYLHD